MVELRYPVLRFHPREDEFVVWLRWVAMEDPPTPADPPHQGLRVELLLAGNPVLGPTIVYRRELETPLYLRANRLRAAEICERVGDRGLLDVHLVLHGSIANAPYAALFVCRDYDGQAIDRQVLEGTPLLQLQPSVPGHAWHVAGQASLRLRLELEAPKVARLKVLR